MEPKVHKVFFTARQVTAITALATAIGTALVSFGILTNEQGAGIAGIVLGISGVLLAFQQAGANDNNTKSVQAELGTAQDAKIGAISINQAASVAQMARQFIDSQIAPPKPKPVQKPRRK